MASSSECKSSFPGSGECTSVATSTLGIDSIASSPSGKDYVAVWQQLARSHTTAPTDYPKELATHRNPIALLAGTNGEATAKSMLLSCQSSEKLKAVGEKLREAATAATGEAFTLIDRASKLILELSVLNQLPGWRKRPEEFSWSDAVTELINSNSAGGLRVLLRVMRSQIDEANEKDNIIQDGLRAASELEAQLVAKHFPEAQDLTDPPRSSWLDSMRKRYGRLPPSGGARLPDDEESSLPGEQSRPHESSETANGVMSARERVRSLARKFGR